MTHGSTSMVCASTRGSCCVACCAPAPSPPCAESAPRRQSRAPAGPCRPCAGPAAPPVSRRRGGRSQARAHTAAGLSAPRPVWIGSGRWRRDARGAWRRASPAAGRGPPVGAGRLPWLCCSSSTCLSSSSTASRWCLKVHGCSFVTPALVMPAAGPRGRALGAFFEVAGKLPRARAPRPAAHPRACRSCNNAFSTTAAAVCCACTRFAAAAARACHTPGGCTQGLRNRATQQKAQAVQAPNARDFQPVTCATDDMTTMT